MRKTLVFMWSSSLRGNLDFCFSGYCYKYWQKFYFEWRTERTVTISSSSRLCQKRGFESWKCSKWFQKLSLLYKIMKSKSPFYPYNLIPTPSTTYSTGNSENLVFTKVSHSFFKNSFFPHHHRMEQIRFEYPYFFFFWAFQKTNFRA